MDKSCPHCQGTAGYYQVQQVRRHQNHTWDGSFSGWDNEGIFYKGKAYRCIDCEEKVLSFVKGLHREIDNE